MDSEITSFATDAGATLVTLMATDAWERTREGVLRLWRRVQPDRAETVAATLELDREDLVAANLAGDEETVNELRAQWEGRMRRLLVSQPAAAGELRRLLEELAPSHGAPAAPPTQRATASGHARIYQAGRDQHITER